MSWVESARWNGILGILETVVITVCTWYFLNHTKQPDDREQLSRTKQSDRAKQLSCTEQLNHMQQSADKRKRNQLGMCFLYWGGFSGIAFGLKDVRAVNIALPVFMIVMTMLMGYTLYDRRKISRFFYFLFPVTMIVVQIFVVYLVVGYMSSKWGTMIFDYYLANVSLIIRQLAEILLTGIWAVVLDRGKYEDVKGVRFLGLFLPPAVSVFIIFSLIRIGNVYMQLYGAFLIIMDIFFLVFMNLYIWYLFSYQSRNKKLEAELEIRRNQSEMQYQYYEKVEQQYQSSRKMIHDMRNHLQAIEVLKKQDGAQEKEYIKDMHQMLDSFAIVSYTDQRMLNIILNDKASIAEKKGIEMNIRIGEIHLEQIRDMDITTIFANLLDNALEAAEQAEENRQIQIRADAVHDFVAVRIQNSMGFRNPVSGVPFTYIKKADGFHKDQEEKLPRRKERQHMGIGLDNVRHTLEKYGGGMMVEMTETEFTVNITIPRKDEESETLRQTDQTPNE